jgi:hypothetical protein
MSKKNLWFVLAGLALSLALAFFVSPFASSSPDGLEKVAEDKGFLVNVEKAEPSWKSSPMPDYTMPGVENEAFSTGLAGIIGTVSVFVVGLVLTYLVTLRMKAEAVSR